MNKPPPFETSLVLSALSNLPAIAPSGSSYSTFASTGKERKVRNDRTYRKMNYKMKRMQSEERILEKLGSLVTMDPGLESPRLSPGIMKPTKLGEGLNGQNVNDPLSEITLFDFEKPIPELKTGDYEIKIETPPVTPTTEENLSKPAPEAVAYKYYRRWQSYTQTKKNNKRYDTFFRCLRFYKGYIGGSMPLLGKTVERIDFAPLYLLTAADSICRGAGQVVFMNNTITGLFILGALILASPIIGLAGLLGVTTSTLTAIVLGLNKSAIRAGLYGYNGLLTGLAIATFYSNLSFGLLVGPLIFCSILSVFLSIALSNLLAPQWDLPCFTLPFNIITAVFIVASVGVANFPRAAAPALAIPTLEVSYGAFPWASIPEIILIGVSQVFLAANWISGLLMLVGIAICSPIACLMAILGSTLGMLTALALGASAAEITFGLWGYNSALGAIAISVFFVFNVKVFILAMLCAITCALFFALCKVAFVVIALPALTFPFCLAALIFVLVKRSIPGIQPVPLSEADFPEKNIRNLGLKMFVINFLREKMEFARRDKKKKSEGAAQMPASVPNKPLALTV